MFQDYVNISYILAKGGGQDPPPTGIQIYKI